jgi:serine/threonine-protein kinase
MDAEDGVDGAEHDIASEDPVLAPPDPLLGATLGAGYRLVHRLGSGGMGAVYEAVSSDGQRLALKVVLPERASQSPRAERRFLREARALLELDHPNIVRVFDAGVDAGRGIAFIAMELLSGVDLARLLARQGPLEPACAARLFCDACAGLAAAHDSGLVHRDVKPSNLFLHELPTELVQPKLCDFGAAKWSVGLGGHQPSEDLTRTGNVVGSPLFMSPEQALGTEELDVRTDIWSLGVSLYCALAGRSPWRGTRTLAELFVSICTAPVPHVQDAAPWIPAGLAEVVHRALRRRPEERFASMRELAQALEPFAMAGPVAVSMLESVSDSTRERVAARAAGPETVTTEAAGLSHTVADATPRGSRRGRTARWVGGVVALGGVAGVTWLFGLGGAGGNAPVGWAAAEAARASRASSISPLQPDAARKHGQVEIVPPDALVTVDGVPRELQGGRLVLDGDPGDQFDVVVTSGASTARTHVVLTKLGTAAPARIELGAGPAPRASPPNASDRAPRAAAGSNRARSEAGLPPTDGRARPGGTAPSGSGAADAEPLGPIESW